MTFDEIMAQWDKYSQMLRDGDKSSLPRDWFENLIGLLMVCPECEKELKPTFSPQCSNRLGNYFCILEEGHPGQHTYKV